MVEDVAFRVLAAGNHPDFRTIADFRKTHLTALRGFFEQVLRLARELGAPRVGRVAVDGSKIRANASKHKAMSYGRLGEKQRQLREEVQALLEEAEATDSAEDAEHGPERRGDELPAELRRRASRLQRIREATRALEARAKDEAAAAGQPAKSAKPAPKAQYNFTDPESRIMKSPDGFVQAYNVQVAVDELQLIVGQAVTQETNDKKQLMPMITTIAQQSGDTPTQLLADAGYCSDRNLTAIGETSIDAFISTRKQTHGERPGPCPRGPLPKTATIIDRMSRTLHTKAGAAVYAARKGIVEPVIGQIKQARGFRQFLLGDSSRCKGNGRWCARRTTFSSCIASAGEPQVEGLLGLAPAGDAEAAIAESRDRHGGRAARGNVIITRLLGRTPSSPLEFAQLHAAHRVVTPFFEDEVRTARVLAARSHAD